MTLVGLPPVTMGSEQAPDLQPGTAASAEAFLVNGDRAALMSDVIDRYRDAMRELEALKRDRKRVARKLRAESQLRPWQVELLKLQMHLEKHRMRMIVLFEGRDAAGKGGTIRRVTRYMNEKHYRVVALGKPTEDQRSEWYFQRYAAQLPAGGEIVLFDRSWYNRAMVEPVFGFCTEEEYQNFMLGVTGFEKDLSARARPREALLQRDPGRADGGGLRVGTPIRCGSGSSARSTCRLRTAGTSSPVASTR